MEVLTGISLARGEAGGPELPTFHILIQKHITRGRKGDRAPYFSERGHSPQLFVTMYPTQPQPPPHFEFASYELQYPCVIQLGELGGGGGDFHSALG